MKTWIYKTICLIVAVTFTVSIISGVSYAKEKSTAPKESDITVTNNTRARDTVDISGLSVGDLVKVYGSADGTKALGSGTVSSYDGDIKVSISQLGVNAGSIYISVTSDGADESERVKVDFEEEIKSDDPLPENITIENNAGVSDVVYVSGLATGDIVKVYNSAKGGKQLGTGTMTSNKTEVSVRIGQLGSDGGSVFVSVTSVSARESNRIEAFFSSEPQSDDPLVESILITNNAGIADTVYVTNLSASDTIKVYNSDKGGKMMGSTIVPSNSVEATVSIKQLGAKGGSVYITITSKGYGESNRIKVDFPAEVQTPAPASDSITVYNNPLGTADTVEVIGLSGSDVVKVYNDSKAGRMLGAITAGANAYQATVSIPQIGVNNGSIFVTVTTKGLSESERIEIPFSAEPKTDAPSLSYITVTNNAGTPDTVEVACISTGDIVKVYNANKGGRLLGTATVASNQSGVTVPISQLGTTAGTVYVSVTTKGANASDRTAAEYSAETISSILTSNNIAITNNPTGTSDTVVVGNLSSGDSIKVYDAVKGGNLLGSATVASGKTEATATIAQLGISSGIIYISYIGKNKLESSRLSVNYSAETTSISPLTDNVAITNNAGIADTIEVTGLTANDTVNVYDCDKGGKPLVTSTVQSGKTYVSMSVPQLGTSSGSVYISIITKGKNESSRIQFNYGAEGKTADPNGDNIIITNNAGVSDTVEVTGISSGDTVCVYNSEKGGKLLGSAVVAASKTSVVITIAQLGTYAGSAYVSVTSDNKLESSRLKVDYSAEAKTNTLAKENITISNNPAGTPDTLDIIGLTAGDIINVYDLAKGGNLLGTATVQSGKTVATVSVTQLGISSGNVYVTVTGLKKQESERVQVSYVAESKTDAPDSATIVITNNPVGTSDTVDVTKLSSGDTVSVYDSATGSKPIATATVKNSDNSVTVTIAQLGSYAGSVYVTVTGKNKLESDRVKIDYVDEKKSNKPVADNVTINNNAGSADTLAVSGLIAGDIIKVYDSANGGSLLGQATVANGSTNAVVDSLQLGATSGTVYITLISKNKLESDRIAINYDAEAKTDAPIVSKIYITNNAGTSDIVKVTGLSAGYVVKVYDQLTGGVLLGTGTVATYKTEVSISIDQLGSDKGIVYISATGTGYKLESDRTKVDYIAEPVSSTPNESNITIINNAGIADTIKVIGLSSGDTINIYDASVGGNIIGSATVASGKTDTTVTIEQLGTGEGLVYVTLTGKNKLESDRKEVGYLSETKSAQPEASKITVANNAGIASTVTVTELSGFDIVNVYETADKTKLLGSGTVPEYYTEVTFDISQLGSTPSYVYVTVTSYGKLESEAAKASYGAKPQTSAPVASYITVTNNAGVADTVTVTNLKSNDIIKIYSDPTKNDLLGTATVQNSSSEATISITQIGTIAGNIYVSITSVGMLESNRTTVGFTAEKCSTAPVSGNITVTNNAGMAAIVTVTGLTVNDVVKVYDAAEGGNLLGSATMSSLKSSVVVDIPQLGTSSGFVYVSVKSVGKTESPRTAASYTAVSAAPQESNVTIVNNVNINDTITVSGLNANDMIKVYDSAQGGTLYGKASTTGTQATVSVPQLTTGAGTVYITITSFGKAESTRTAVDYSAEQNSTAPYEGNIEIVNNAVIADTVTVTGLSPYDVVRVYDTANGDNILGYATVPSGNSQVTVKISQLGTAAGTVYISVISLGKYESNLTPVLYTTEQSSIAPSEGNISIVNGTGTSGTVTVTGLQGNDTVKVYDSPTGGNMLSLVTVPSTGTQTSFTITQMNVNGGSIYISVTSTGKTESDRTRASYPAR